MAGSVAALDIWSGVLKFPTIFHVAQVGDYKGLTTLSPFSMQLWCLLIACLGTQYCIIGGKVTYSPYMQVLDIAVHRQEGNKGKISICWG